MKREKFRVRADSNFILNFIRQDNSFDGIRVSKGIDKQDECTGIGIEDDNRLVLYFNHANNKSPEKEILFEKREKVRL